MRSAAGSPPFCAHGKSTLSSQCLLGPTDADLGLEMIVLSEVSQTEKDKYHMIPLICGIYKKDTNELIRKTETDSQT